jgi:hypothetical protein
MPNDIQTMKDAPGVIAALAAKMLSDKVQFAKTIDQADQSDYNGKNGYMAGDTILINKNARFISGTTADITSTIQDVVEEKVPLVLDERRVTAIALTSQEIATELALKSWANRILDPAISEMAQKIEASFLEKAKNAVYNSVGSAGSTVFDMDTILSAGQKIDEFACPDLDNRYVLLNPAAQRSAVNSNKGLFNADVKVAQQYIKGRMGTAMGFDFLSNNLLSQQTNGNDVTGVAMNATISTEGTTSLVLKGLTANTGTVAKGSVFTIATVNAVHPITKADLGYLQQFVVTNTPAAATAGGLVTVTVSPAIYTSASKGLQSVTAFPAADDAIVFVGAADSVLTQNLAYHKSAFRMVSVPLVTPGGTDMAAQKTHEGFTIRVIRDYDVLSDKLIMRLDFLGGICATRPEWAVRITQ